MPELLPTLHPSSAAYTTEQDAMRAALSFRDFQRGKSGGPIVASSRQIVDDNGSEVECEDLLTESRSRHRSDRPVATKTKLQNKGKDVKSSSSRKENATSLGQDAHIAGLETSGSKETSAQSAPREVVTAASDTAQPEVVSATASLATPEESPSPNGSNGAVMVLMSSTQATICIVAALLLAALLGAFILWLTLAFDLLGHVAKAFSFAPNTGVQLRRAFSRELQFCLEEIIVWLGELRDWAAQAQDMGEM